MGNIVIPEAALDQFLQSLLAGVTKENEGLKAEFRARLNAHEAMFRAQLEVALERRLREAEEKIERKMRAVEEEIERKRRAVDEEIERKRRAAEEEIERKRRAAEAVEQAAVSAPPYRAGPERGQNGGMDGPGSLAGSVDEDELGSASRDGFR